MHPMSRDQMGVHWWPPAGGVDVFGDGKQFWEAMGRRGGKILSRGTGWDGGNG